MRGRAYQNYVINSIFNYVILFVTLIRSDWNQIVMELVDWERFGKELLVLEN